MAQRIEYAVFPGARDETLLPTVGKVLGHVRRTAPTLRDFREWLKEAGLWSKDDQPVLQALLDLEQTAAGTIGLGPWANQFLDAADEAKTKDQLYKRLLDENTLLVKYVLEALDTDGGGRLHSTYELHRMLTSYVYPGKHIGLVAFQSWIRWMVASGRVKLIGIRWGLTDIGKLAVPRLRTIDVEEFLEDEAAAQQADGEPAGVGAVAAAVVSAPPPVAAPRPVPQPSAPQNHPQPAPDDPEETLDLPPEAGPIDEQVAAQWETQHLGAAAVQTTPTPAPTPAPTEVVAAPPKSTRSKTPIGAGPTPAVVAGTDPADPAPAIAALRAWGQSQGLGGGSQLALAGVEARLAATEPWRQLFLAAVLARLAQSAHADAATTLLRTAAGGSWGPVALLADRPAALLEVLSKWQLAGDDPVVAVARDAVVLAAVAASRTAQAAALPAALGSAATGEVLVDHLLETVLYGAPPVAALWLVHEQVRAGVWRHKAATDIAAVPSRAVRLMAYRLRLVDRHFADSPAALVSHARRLAQLLPPGSAESLALQTLAPTDHLRFDCRHVPVCDSACVAPA
jgi:hypothetical protein